MSTELEVALLVAILIGAGQFGASSKVTSSMAMSS